MISRDNNKLPLGIEDKEIICALLDSSFDGIAILDADQKVLYAGKAINRIVGLTPERLIGKTLGHLIKSNIIPKDSVTEMVFKTKKNMSSLLELVPGSKVILTTANPCLDSDGNLRYVIVNIRNIRELGSMKCDLKQIYTDNGFLSKLSEKIKDYRLREFVAKSQKMLEIVDFILSVADQDLNYLITGETGIGKGVLAKFIHSSGARKSRPFVDINCAAIPADLMESEFFGYTGGAFSGARKAGQKGLLELANNGIVFFDEIGLMPWSLQSKILKFLDDKKIRRLGSSCTIDLDVQIIAATNRNLKKAKDEGTFRGDLFYRLNEVGLELPPLRHRPEDLDELINVFWARYNKAFNKKVLLDDQALRRLQTYHYPGNIRELENVIRRLIIKTKKTIVEVEDVSEEIRLASSPYQDFEEEYAVDELDLTEKVELYERDMIQKAYLKYSSTYTAAESLGMKQSTFYRRAKKYSII